MNNNVITHIRLLICLHFLMTASRINKEGVSLWCG